ncbi:hypothetical protein [Metabacillus sp. 84]|uniref:hypothetical protein n=1 Tax=unclassified Metabacillus TaxID=2675274 RepID=UPI003CEF2A09
MKNPLAGTTKQIFRKIESFQNRKMLYMYREYLQQLTGGLQTFHSLMDSHMQLKLECLYIKRRLIQSRLIHLDLRLLQSKDFVFSDELKKVWIGKTMNELKNNWQK